MLVGTFEGLHEAICVIGELLSEKTMENYKSMDITGVIKSLHHVGGGGFAWSSWALE